MINETNMVCQLPSNEDLAGNTNTASISRSKRNAVTEDAKFSQTTPRSGKSFIQELNNWITHWLEDKPSGRSVTQKSIRSKRDAGGDNATKNSSQNPYKLYLGLDLDNYPKYTNLTRSFPRYQPKLDDGPFFKVISRDTPQEYDPRTGESFKIVV